MPGFVDLNAILLALLSAILFGASTPASKALLGDLTPFQLAGLLYLGAVIGVSPRLFLERSRGEPPKLDAANRRRLAGAVLLGGIVGPLLLLLALRVASAASVSLLLNLELAATALIGVVLYREHIGLRGWAGVAGTIGAGSLLAARGGPAGVAAAALAAGACVCWGFDNQLTALIDGMSPARCTFWKGIVAGVTNLALGVSLVRLQAEPTTILAALAVGAVSYGASIALHIAAAQRLGATRTQGIFASAPFFGAAFSFLVFRESFGGTELAAGGLFLASVALLVLERHAHLHQHAADEHLHSHRHDDGHHAHEHSGLPVHTRHSHWHTHEPLEHAHAHPPDLHHRHVHEK
ncbi:MAG TPA: EamA family transporter [Planctomycetota bacterium]|jgi:drug/metabolite transporter (DMT)-like permease|nr:EamA family transporter [Planctomycetota bacterium]